MGLMVYRLLKYLYFGGGVSVLKNINKYLDLVWVEKIEIIIIFLDSYLDF